MTVVAFPTSGLTPADLRVLEEFCSERRLRGVPSYLSIGEIEPDQQGHARLLYATIRDAPEGKTVFIVDRTEGVYRVRYWHSIQRQMMLLAKQRHLSAVLGTIPEWPAVPFRRPQRRQ